MSDWRADTHTFLNALIRIPDSDLDAFARTMIGADCVWDVAAPVGRLKGVDAVLDGLIRPLRRALWRVHRRDEIFFGARNRRHERGNWICSVTHYVGIHDRDLLGVRPAGRLAFVRSGEFYRIEDGMIVEAKIIIDLLDLMRQAGRYPLPRMLGTEMLFPGPATHDGILPNDPARGDASLDIVEAMIGDLHDFDPDTFHSEAQTGTHGHWHEDMMWYGPGGIGSTFGWDGFVNHHRASFLRAFPDRRGGNHFCRIGDGDYAAFSGWPSMTMTHRGDYLGVPATGRSMTLNVMDFYRIADAKIIENWVLLDYVHLFAQMDVDVIARSAAMDSHFS